MDRIIIVSDTKQDRELVNRIEAKASLAQKYERLARAAKSKSKQQKLQHCANRYWRQRQELLRVLNPQQIVERTCSVPLLCGKFKGAVWNTGVSKA